MNLAHTKTAVLSWYVQNFIVIRPVFSKPQWWQYSSNFEFHRNLLSGTLPWCGYSNKISHMALPQRAMKGSIKLEAVVMATGDPLAALHAIVIDR